MNEPLGIRFPTTLIPENDTVRFNLVGVVLALKI